MYGRVATSARLGELGLGFLLSAVVGFERDQAEERRAAHTLFGVGAALFVLISRYGFRDVLLPRQVSSLTQRLLRSATAISALPVTNPDGHGIPRQVLKAVTNRASRSTSSPLTRVRTEPTAAGRTKADTAGSRVGCGPSPE
jgi:hypothetical protein